MVAASLCGNPIRAWQTQEAVNWCLEPLAHPGDHPDRSRPSCTPTNSSAAALWLPHHCKRWWGLLVTCPTGNFLLCPKGQSRETQAATSKTPGPHESFVVHLHRGRICCQVLTPNTSHCGHTAFSYHFPHPFPRACENKAAYVWQLLHAESWGVIMESSDGNDLPTSLHIAQPASFFCYRP